MVIHDICQVICRQGIDTLIQYLVIERRGVHLDVAADQVVHLDRLVARHLEAYNPLVAAVDALTHLLRRQRQRRRQLLAYRIVIGESLAARLALLAQGVQLGRRVEGVVCPPRLDKLQGIFEIYLAAFALTIGSVRAPDTDTLVDLDTAPAQRLDYILLGSRHETLRVGILYTQDHLAPVVAGKQIVVKCRTYASHVKGSRRTRRKAHPYLL